MVIRIGSKGKENLLVSGTLNSRALTLMFAIALLPGYLVLAKLSSTFRVCANRWCKFLIGDLVKSRAQADLVLRALGASYIVFIRHIGGKSGGSGRSK